MAKELNTDIQEIFRTSLEEAKKKARAKKYSDENDEEENEEEEDDEEDRPRRKVEEEMKGEKEYNARYGAGGKKRPNPDDTAPKPKKKKMEEEYEDMDEETLAASSLHPGAKSISDPKSKIGMMQAVMGTMNGMSKGDLTGWFNQTMAQFGPGKDYGVGDNYDKNISTIDMKTGKGPKTKYPMPTLNVKEDLDPLFEGQDLSEEFKDSVCTIFEAAIGARVIAEVARLEEEYEEIICEQIISFNEELTTKLDTYLDYVVEQWMEENEVAIESTLRNELMEEFMEGLRNLFSDHYISVPQEKVDVLEALAEKVGDLEERLDETITENVELKNYLLEGQKEEVLESISSGLALTQQEKFAALAEGIEFDGDLNIYAKKLRIIRENYFKTESTQYSSNINEETFEGDIGTNTVNVDPSVNRYVQAIARTIKK
jgi:hypothetical protein